MADSTDSVGSNDEEHESVQVKSSRSPIASAATSTALANSMQRLSIQPVRSSPSKSASPIEMKYNSNNNSRPTSRPASRPSSSASRSASHEQSRRASSSSYQQASSPKLLRKSSTSSLKNVPTTPTKPILHRSSSGYNSPKTVSSPTMATVYEPPPLTPSKVAADFFQSEWESHKSYATTKPDTIAIIHDSCYGHRFARPKTSKANLGLIVERPERIQAGVLGLSTAYVRCGERHENGRYAPAPNKSVGQDIPFIIHKSIRLTPLDSSPVTSVHGMKWMQELGNMCNSAERKLASGGKELLRPEDSTSNSPKHLLHENDLYLCKDSLEAFEGALGGVFDGIDAVFNAQRLNQDGEKRESVAPNYKRAFVCIRPPGHHCSTDFPSGFCWLNNVHVGIEYAAQTYGLTHAAIIDFDLHHGDGSQAIAWERNTKAIRAHKNAPIAKKTAIGYFSIHDINSYPCEDGDFEKVRNASVCVENAHGQTIWNVHLQPWKTEQEFWDLYENQYSVLLMKARNFLRLHSQKLVAGHNNVPPKAAIFISAGFDASEWEGQGMQRHKVNVPTEFYARFTSDITKLAEEDGTGAHGRVISVLEGGYSDRALTSGVLSHMVGLTKPSSSAPFPRDWWATNRLTDLEVLVNPPPLAAPKKQPRHLEPPTYTTLTQSFTAKVVDPVKMHRLVSNSNYSGPSYRPPTPPPPEVDWAIAAYELSRILIPSDRQVNSHRHEDLTEPKVKRDRHSSAVLPSTIEHTTDKMQLRDRKAKAIPTLGKSTNEDILPVRERSRTSRRRTISDLSETQNATQAQSRPGSTSGSRPPSSKGMSLQPVDESNQVTPVPEIVANSSIPADAAELKIAKTRRPSGIKATKSANTAMPPPPLHPSVKVQRPAAVSRTKSEGSFKLTSNKMTDVDQLATGVKKITLRLSSQDAATAKDHTNVTATDSSVTKKSTVPRPARAVGAKANTTKAMKSSKTPGISQSHASHEDSVKTTSNGQTNRAIERSTKEASNLVLSGYAPTSSVTSSKNGTDLHLLTSDTIEASQRPNSDGLTNLDRRLSREPSATATLPVPVQDDHVKPVADLTLPDDFIHYNAASRQKTGATYINPQNLTWLPPNTGTPSQTPNKRGKDDLPVFSAAGPIPFSTGISMPSSDPITESSNEDA